MLVDPFSDQPAFNHRDSTDYHKVTPMTDTLTVFPFRNPRSLVIGFLVVVGLYLTSLYHYLLFHSISELFSIVIACAFFMIAWNSRDLAEDSYLVYLGIAYLFIAVLDLLHTLSYKGMNIFQDYDFYANQLWIAGRYMEGVTLLIFWGMAGRRRRVAYGPVFAVYTAVTAVLIATVFYWKVFPVCFVEGEGLTRFKVVSEYIICGILGLALLAAHKNRNVFDPAIHRLLTTSVLLTIGGELAFTFYISNYGFSNLVGHYLKIASFFLIYKAIIETGLKQPFNLIFSRLKESEARYRHLFESSLVGIFRMTLDGGRILEANPASARIMGYETPDAMAAELVPREIYANPEDRDQLRGRLLTEGRLESREVRVRDRAGREHTVQISAVVAADGDFIEGAMLDVSEKVEMARRMAQAAEQEAIQRGKIAMAASVLHDIGNAVTGLGTTVTRFLGDDDWPEIAALDRLSAMVEEKRGELDAALGPGKGEALAHFIRELRGSLADRRRRLGEDGRVMSKTLSHVNEILHLQRRYARESGPGPGTDRLDMAELIDDALAMQAAGLRKRGITVRRHYPPGLHGISGDRTRLIQVFMNLIKNAAESFDALDAGGDRTLDIDAEVLNGRGIRVMITDNGAGFPTGEESRFFEAGYSTKDRSSGVGLSQCRAIVTSHGGTIELHSDGPGRGSRAMIELPIQEETDA